MAKSLKFLIEFTVKLLVVPSKITVLSSPKIPPPPPPLAKVSVPVTSPVTDPVRFPTTLPTTDPVCYPLVSPVRFPVSVVAATVEVSTGPTIFPLIASTKRVESSA